MEEKDLKPVKDRELKAILDRLGEKIRGEEVSPSEATKRLRALLAESPPEKVQHHFGFVPTPMARTSPFFPMSDREKAHRPYETLSNKTSWGKIEIKGPRLSIFEEDVLLAVLALLKTTRRREETETPEGRRTYTIRTSMLAICQYLKVKRGKNIYKYIEEAMERLTGTLVTLEVHSPGKGKRARESGVSMGGAILSGWFRERKSGKLIITLNPYFYEMFAEGLLTYLDLTLRRRLKGEISKALLRFYESHRSLPIMHMMTIGDAINLRTLEPRRVKERLKKALRELKREGYLREARVDKSGMVRVRKGTPPIVKPGAT